MYGCESTQCNNKEGYWIKIINILILLESVKLMGEGEYNLDDTREIEVTDSHLKLDKTVRGVRLIFIYFIFRNNYTSLILTYD